MGIPSYFSHIIKNYASIIKNLQHVYNNVQIEHLYMDCNSIIYDAVHSIEKEQSVDIESDIIKKVIVNIKKYIEIIRPTKTIFIAFDGVAPFAKMDQQRTRRYKNAFLSKISFDDANKKKGWNTSAITPGTTFMEKLSSAINYEFKYCEKRYNCLNILVSCSDQEGEGEHKLFQHLRENNFLNDTVSVYGLDADLIMLSIFHLKYCGNIYIFREAPEFLKSSIPVDVRGKESEPYFLDIRHLASCILSEMDCKFSDKQRIHDYVFICFFLGNDFLPHFPAMNIRTHGIQALLDIYRMVIGNYQDRYFISKNNGKIQWRNVRIFISEIAKREHEFLMNEYYVRDKFDKRYFPETTPKEKEDVLQNAPIIYRQKEKYICPQEPEWEKRYYKSLFSLQRTSDNLKNISMNYLEGLEWTYKYYTSGCPDWKWKYNYSYPPLFMDLVNYIPHFETDFIIVSSNNRSFFPYTQLAYVLPFENLHLLPNKLCEFLRNNYSEQYPTTYELEWAYCRYLWESHPVLPDISLETLENLDIQFRMCEVN